MNTLLTGTRKPHLPGEAGIWVFVFGDMLIFGLFFSTYSYYRLEDIDAFRAAQQQLSTNLGMTNTLVLLCSSLLIMLALQAIRSDKRRIAMRCIAGAFAFGLAFLGIKFIEYGDKISAGITLTSNDFFMYYFMFTGIHLIHLLLGLAVLIVLFFRLKNKENTISNDMPLYESGAVFWHMVDLLWIVLFPLLYLM